MERLISFKGYVNCPWFTPHYNWGVDAKVTNPGELNRAKRTWEEKNQTELIELGSDQFPKKTPRTSKIDNHQVYREMKAMRGR
jgi:hypothetical protein